ncbi:uncharacterized protein LOC111591648 [Ceratitis capitata]|uniref:uncharacterized protein LOC111591648 n=1 Tax=Ceratitis capitata TaxID=7213 RepID=UPI000C6C5927|nr:uncharacterized protein LOC111591648 [Ceratitis capitata]
MAFVFLDRCSKWVEIVAVRKATTEGLTRAFRERILARFGFPKILITDNGERFTSMRFKDFLREHRVKHQLTAPYTPQEIPTERANRNIKRMIARFTGKEQRDLDELLSEITLAHNTCVGEFTSPTKGTKESKMSDSETKKGSSLEALSTKRESSQARRSKQIDPSAQQLISLSDNVIRYCSRFGDFPIPDHTETYLKIKDNTHLGRIESCK